MKAIAFLLAVSFGFALSPQVLPEQFAPVKESPLLCLGERGHAANGQRRA